MSTISHSSKVPFGQKVAFGLGMLANQMFPAVLGIFTVVLIENLGFPGWWVGFLYFFPRIFDAITDPIMGFISDNTKSKWGRRRHYVVIGAIVMAVSFAFMWQLYTTNSVNFNFVYFLLWSLAFYLGLTIFSVPYVAMGYEMSDDFHERTNVMATAQLIGQLAWVIAPWFWVIMGDKELFNSGEVATRTLAIYVAIACGVLAAIPGIFIKSKSTLEEDYAPLTMKTIGSSFDLIITGFKEALKIEPFKKLCIATFLIFNAFNTVAAFSYYIIKYYLFTGDGDPGIGLWPTLFGSVGALVTTVAVIPIVSIMSRKMGKKRAFLVSQGISIIGYILLWVLFIPGKPYLFLFALPFFSFGIGSLFTLMMSMTSDVIDIDEVNTNKRREGIFGAIYWWMVKFGLAIAGLLSGVILSLVSFESGATTQTPEAMTGLRLFFSGLPILGTLGAMWVMRNYDVTEEKARETSAQLAQRKQDKNIPISSSFYALNKLESLVSLNGNRSYPTDLKMSSTFIELEEQFKTTLNAGLHGICFSPYKEGQNVGNQLKATQIDERMAVIESYTNWIRSFSCTQGNELIPLSARSKGIKTMIGAWISDNRAQNELEIQGLIAQAQKGMVDIAVVGNEVLLRDELTIDELLSYIDKVKEALPDIQVAYVDAYYQFVENPELVEACDVILINCYPFWEGCEVEKSTAYLNEMYDAVVRVAHDKKIIITETGWPNEGSENLKAIPSNENAMRYFVNAVNWSKHKGVELFYFSSFDESWKVHQEGDVGARWGIWDKNEQLKY